MRTALSITPAFILLAACNRPVQAPEVDVLATRVAATLTAQPPAADPTVTPSVTALPTTTLIPSETPDPSEPTETATVPTPTLSPLDPDDPRFGLDMSDPQVLDDFSQRFTWFEFDDPETATIVWQEGRLRATDNLADAFLWWSTTARQASDLYVEVTAAVGQCAGKDAYGVAVRVGGVNYDQGYTLEVACDGTYRVRKFISEEAPAILLDWTPSELIVGGSEVVNRIGLVAEGAQLHPVINGELVAAAPIRDSAYQDGFFSLFSSAAQTDGLTVFFDDFKVWTLSP